ncbi:MAG TPA: RagB/SusD family nutrient uptake outer membrane protein [Flavisolibacter sp.]|nr:RagB/SusD family nutrient uptake outer membrane protein [Flavisolibacter sp.]
MCITGCKKVEIKPEGQVEVDDAIQDEADVKAILNAAYTPLRGDQFYGGRQQILSELMADVVNGQELTGEWNSIYNFNSGSGMGSSNDFYGEAYLIILRANVALEHLDKVTSSEATRNNLEGQAKFVRALAHFELVRLYAQPYGYTANNSHPGIVIKTISEMETGRSRNSVQEVYNQVIADLKSAESLLPPTNGNYPGSLAAKAMLAKVHFQMNKFEEAYAYADQVITSGQFTFDNSADYVTNRFNLPKSSEAVFYLVNEPGTQTMDGLRNGANPEMSLRLPITKAAYDEAKANPADIRFAAWYKDSLNAATNTHTYSIRKYKQPDFVLPIIHLTELKLIRAESATELNKNLDVAIADINDITNRAYGGAVAPLAANATAAAIKTRVRAERKKEMIFETGDRLQQIKRIGAKGEASTSRTAPWNCNGMILQFHTNEITVNKFFVQNPTGGCN